MGPAFQSQGEGGRDGVQCCLGIWVPNFLGFKVVLDSRLCLVQSYFFKVVQGFGRLRDLSRFGY